MRILATFGILFLLVGHASAQSETDACSAQLRQTTSNLMQITKHAQDLQKQVTALTQQLREKSNKP